MYADDRTLIGSVEDFLSSESNESTENIITEGLTKISTWMEVNKLLINENTTKILIVKCHIIVYLTFTRSSVTSVITLKTACFSQLCTDYFGINLCLSCAQTVTL